MNHIKQVSEEKDVALAALCDSLEISRATLYRKNKSDLRDATDHPKKPHNALDVTQRQEILDLLHSDRFVDSTPYNVFYTLLDEGQYISSIRTMYRVLFESGEARDRRDLRNHRDAIKPELIATAPNQVWTWDITKIRSFKRFTYFHLYVIIDIYSRYVVGWMIADRECQHLAKKLIQKSVLKHSIQPGELTIHSDNGPSMTSQTVSQLLDKIGVLKTHNRPYTSNDNPFSESQFKTMKYCPEFPDQFESLETAEKFCIKFFNWYNNEHYHSGILFLKLTSVHFKQSDEILNNRHQVILKAYEKNPARFNQKIPILKKLKPVYINPPEIEYENNSEKNKKNYLQKRGVMA